MLICWLLMALFRADATAPSTERTVRTWSLTTLSPVQARVLHGQRARFAIELDSPVEDKAELGYRIAGCKTADDQERGVYFCRDQVVDEAEVDVLVEGRLLVIRQREWMGVPSYLEYRIVDAVRVRPR
jgi:hypothetical protein